MARDFLDTNVLIYAFTDDPRAAQAQSLLQRRCIISVQGLNEFTNVARRKLGMDWSEVQDALAALITLCEDVRPLDIEMHRDAIRLAQRFGFPIFDALVVAAALRAGSPILWSEDLQDGLIIEGRIRISNPFASDIR